ncbi:DUF6443 domain-containing protein [Chryseobacterium camelliae]|uniref:DUF6443 domain-containing protein n=1 Tax=Chryseobacterium camelliae TaxID=1265445 RepID=UPI0028554B3B|nr:DUF6443 domain-containing protein [Chryseobacterium camelliae]MDR6515928.1 RHS repeat-associated protein [Chryseobacterium camelliae]
MKRLLYIVLLYGSGIVFGQSLSSSENYVYTRSYLEPVSATNPGARQVQSVQYMDGLGRTRQEILIQATAGGKDLVVPVEYDASGRQVKSYLPVPADSQGGALQGITGSSAGAYYGVPNAYAEASVEQSPLGRVLRQAHPGADWAMGSGHTLKFSYGANAASEVRRLTATTAWNSSTGMNEVSIGLAPDNSYTSGGYYRAGTLVKKTTRDEDDRETQVFSNASGQTLLVRKATGSGSAPYADTYYVYDDFGNLVLAIPPKVAFSTLAELNSQLDALCYQYRYDRYNRLVEKRLPGKSAWESVVYDKQGRAVLTQDANQASKQWSFVKYDSQGRVAYSGLFSSAASRSSLQATLDNMSSNALNNESRTDTPFSLNGLDIYYTNAAFPTAGMTVMSVNYYDRYPAGSPAVPATVLQQATLPQAPVSITSNGYTTSRSVQSLPVAGYTKNIENDSWSSSFIWYDQKARPVGTYGKNHLGGYTRTESEIDFSGVTKQSLTYHKRLDSNTETVIRQRFVYDSQNRLKQHYHQINAQPEELLSDNTYNDLGQITNKKVGGNLQSIDYRYDLRGRLIKINDPGNLNGRLFGYEARYQNPVGTEAKYNGNITEVDWKSASDHVLRRYDYRYDGLNRLTSAYYREPLSSLPENNFYNEEAGYDLNGNIVSMKRNAKSPYFSSAELIDNLNYAYSGNRLSSVSDTSANYRGYPDTSGNTISYDDNGNMKDQIDKGILQIDYNFLNLPKYIKFNDYASYSRDNKVYVNTTYQYRADGTKLRKVHNYKDPAYAYALSSRTTDYLDGFQYESNWSAGGGSTSSDFQLKFVPTAEGYYDFENNKYIYSYTDHLGNIRLSYYRNGGGGASVAEENNYYAFGLKHEGYNVQGGNPAYGYGYIGKELQKETGMYDFGARMYMPDLGRWGVIDPLAEIMRRHSPYNYAYNNPVNYIDPDGMAPRRLTMAGEGSPLDYQQSPSYNPNWMGMGNNVGYGDSYGFGAVYSGGGGSASYALTGNAAASMFDYFANGGDINGISFNKGWATWWRDGTPGYSNNGETVITGLIGYSFKLFNGGFDSFTRQNISYTNTFGNVTDLVSENPFIKAENEFSVTNGNAKILNFDLKNTTNVSTLKNDTSLDIQLNLSFLNLNSEFGKSSSSSGATISVGNYSAGVAGTLSYDFWNSDYSVKFGQKLSNSTMSTSTYGIKPASAILAIITYGMARFTPPVLWEKPMTIPMY